MAHEGSFYSLPCTLPYNEDFSTFTVYSSLPALQHQDEMFSRRRSLLVRLQRLVTLLHTCIYFVTFCRRKIVELVDLCLFLAQVLVLHYHPLTFWLIRIIPLIIKRALLSSGLLL